MNMKKDVRNELITIVYEIISRIAKHIGIEEDATFQVVSRDQMNKTNSLGEYDTHTHEIQVTHSWDVGADTIFHELTHWVQNKLVGDTQCDSNYNSRGLDKPNSYLIAQFYKIEEQLVEWGYDMGYYQYIKRLYEIYGGRQVELNPRRLTIKL